MEVALTYQQEPRRDVQVGSCMSRTASKDVTVDKLPDRRRGTRAISGDCWHDLSG